MTSYCDENRHDPMPMMIETWPQQRGKPAARRSWEAPAFSVLALGATTGPQAKAAFRESNNFAAAPPPPCAPLAKLGFSFEMAFPLAYHG
jgi:hypothetical protein